MITIDSFRQLAMSFPGATEQPHFELTSFRVNNKIFASMDEKKNRVCLMLTPVDQSVLIAFDETVIYPVPNKWGKNGATYVELKTVRKSMLKDALKHAYDKANAKKVALKSVKKK